MDSQARLRGGTSSDGEENHVTISLTDGMVSNPMTRTQMAAMLNEDDMRPMPNEWLVEIIKHISKTNEGL